MANTLTILTNIGNEKILDAIAQGTSVEISTMVYGDANGQDYIPTVNQTSLRHQIGSIDTLSISFDQPEGFLYITGILQSNAPECVIRELGLIDSDGDLIAISVIPATTKPALEDGLEITMPITIGFKTSNGEVLVIEAGHLSPDYPDKSWVIAYVNDRIQSIKTIYSTTW